MLGSHSKKFLFFHVYKVAGTSMRNVVGKHAEFSYQSPHITPSEFMKINFGFDNKKVFNEYTTFAFVRNPWDWQVSLYHFMLKDKNHKQYHIIKDMNFDQYLDWRLNEDLHLQYEFLSDNFDLESPISIDFIGKFEHLNSDFDFIMNKLGINDTLPHLNKTAHKDYREYYTDETRDLISEAFDKDIEYFGYNFDNENIISGEDVYNEKVTA